MFSRQPLSNLLFSLPFVMLSLSEQDAGRGLSEPAEPRPGTSPAHRQLPLPRVWPLHVGRSGTFHFVFAPAVQNGKCLLRRASEPRYDLVHSTGVVMAVKPLASLRDEIKI